MMNRPMIGMDLPVNSCSSTIPALRARGEPAGSHLFNSAFLPGCLFVTTLLRAG